MTELSQNMTELSARREGRAGLQQQQSVCGYHSAKRELLDVLERSFTHRPFWEARFTTSLKTTLSIHLFARCFKRG